MDREHRRAQRLRPDPEELEVEPAARRLAGELQAREAEVAELKREARWHMAQRRQAEEQLRCAAGT